MDLIRSQILEQLQEYVNNMRDVIDDHSSMDPAFESICECIEQLQHELDFLRLD